MDTSSDHKRCRRLFECAGYLNGQKVSVVFDTGATGDALSEKAARRTGVALTSKDQPKIIGGCGGRELAHYDALAARLFIQQMTFVRNFLVIPSALKADVLLGAKWFNQFRPVFDWVHHFLFITLEPSLHFIIQADPARHRSAQRLAQAADRQANPNVSSAIDKSQEKSQEISKEADASMVCLPEPEVACARKAKEPRRQHHQEQKDTCLEKGSGDEEHVPKKKRKRLEKIVNSSTAHDQGESSAQAVQEALQTSMSVERAASHDSILFAGEGVSSICKNLEDMNFLSSK